MFSWTLSIAKPDENFIEKKKDSISMSTLEQKFPIRDNRYKMQQITTKSTNIQKTIPDHYEIEMQVLS